MSDKNNLISKIENTKSGILNELEELKRLSSTLGSGESVENLHLFVKKVSSSVNQINLISNLLRGIQIFCSRTAIFLLRDDKLVGWGGSGIMSGNEPMKDSELKKIFFSLSADTVFKDVLEQKRPYGGDPDKHKDNHLIYNRFGNIVPDSILVIPFFVKGKPQAVVYTDVMSGAPMGNKEIEILSIVGEMSLDLLPIRQRIMAKVKTQEYESEPESKSDSFQKVVVSAESKPIEIKESDPERLARVIVNDMILYNQKQVEDARQGKRVYDELKATILQSKELYLSKHSDLRPFEIQLVETLADGDRESLNGYKFETI
ncbi:MAG: hypothetical protein ABFR36_03710 [Acidobacteriota bacterium]